MSVNPSGLHHVTAIASDPQRNVDFYTQALGLRLIKQTVNFDAPHIWHLYCGDKVEVLIHPGGHQIVMEHVQQIAKALSS